MATRTQFATLMGLDRPTLALSQSGGLGCLCTLDASLQSSSPSHACCFSLVLHHSDFVVTQITDLDGFLFSSLLLRGIYQALLDR